MSGKAGWLTKEGGKVFKNWKRRWCVLDKETGTLQYYESELSQNPNQKPNGVVLLDETTVTKVPKNTRGKENCLCIQGSERVFYAYADSSAEADAWVEAIRQFDNQAEEPAEEAPVENTVLYSGWLFKEAGSGKNWRKRFFVLRRKDMTYYKDRNAKDPQGQFSIAGANLIETKSNDNASSLSKFNILSGGGGGNPALQFSLQTQQDGNRVYHFEARNALEFKIWTQQIRTAIPKAGKYVPTSGVADKDDDKDDDDNEDEKTKQCEEAMKREKERILKEAKEEEKDEDNEPDEGGEEKEASFLEDIRKLTNELL